MMSPLARIEQLEKENQQLKNDNLLLLDCTTLLIQSSNSLDLALKGVKQDAIVVKPLARLMSDRMKARNAVKGILCR